MSGIFLYQMFSFVEFLSLNKSEYYYIKMDKK